MSLLSILIQIQARFRWTRRHLVAATFHGAFFSQIPTNISVESPSFDSETEGQPYQKGKGFQSLNLIVGGQY
jgi:hypothetical protein